MFYFKFAELFTSGYMVKGQMAYLIKAYIEAGM